MKALINGLRRLALVAEQTPCEADMMLRLELRSLAELLNAQARALENRVSNVEGPA